MIEIDINTLTLDELEAFGDALGIDPMSLDKGWKPKNWKESMRVTRVYLWMVKRRERPDITLDDIGRLTVAEFNELASTLPTPAGVGATSATSRSSRTTTGSRRRISGV